MKTCRPVMVHSLELTFRRKVCPAERHITQVLPFTALIAATIRPPREICHKGIKNNLSSNSTLIFMLIEHDCHVLREESAKAKASRPEGS